MYQIFNFNNNNLVQNNCHKNTENLHIHPDDYKEKYIKLIEIENERLKKELSILKS